MQRMGIDIPERLVHYSWLPLLLLLVIVGMHNGKLEAIMQMKILSIAVPTYVCALKAGHTPSRLGMLGSLSIELISWLSMHAGNIG
jgi:hypothetical protein